LASERVLEKGTNILEARLFGKLAPDFREMTEAAEVEGLSLGVVTGALFLLEGAFRKGCEGGVDDAKAMGFRGVADVFREGGGGRARIGAGLELHAPVFEGKGTLCPELQTRTPPGVETFGGAVMPDFDGEAIGGAV
jgi:hypothetical protein